MPKLTPWYPPEIKPVRAGWYHTSSSPMQYYLIEYWDGTRWRYHPKETPYAENARICWRGQVGT